MRCKAAQRTTQIPEVLSTLCISHSKCENASACKARKGDLLHLLRMCHRRQTKCRLGSYPQDMGRLWSQSMMPGTNYSLRAMSLMCDLCCYCSPHLSGTFYNPRNHQDLAAHLVPLLRCADPSSNHLCTQNSSGLPLQQWLSVKRM